MPGLKSPYLKVAVAAFATDPRIAAFRARFASAMGQTLRCIDLIDADRLLLEVVSSLRASDALDVSARRGVALPLRLRTHC